MVQTWDVTNWDFVVVDETVISVIGVREASDWLVFCWSLSQPCTNGATFTPTQLVSDKNTSFALYRTACGRKFRFSTNECCCSLSTKKTKSALKSSLRMYDKINGSLHRHRSHLNYWGLRCTFVLLFCWSRRCTFNYKML